MSRTTQHRRAKPRPGAAKLGVDLDKEIGAKSEQLAKHLTAEFLKGNPIAMNIIARWAQDADFGQRCEKVHGRTLIQLLQQIESEQDQAEGDQATAEGAETAASSKPEPCSAEVATAAV